MAYHNANIPVIDCYVRGNYLRDQKDSFDKYYECRVFGVTSLPGQVPLFHFLMSDGGIWWKAPISAFCKREGVKELPLNELKDRMKELGYGLSVTPKMKEYLIEKGYDKKYGARPLNRAIQRYLEDPIAEKMLDGELKEGDTIKVNFVNEEVVVTTKKSKK